MICSCIGNVHTLHCMSAQLDSYLDKTFSHSTWVGAAQVSAPLLEHCYYLYTITFIRERGYLVSCTTECIYPKCVFLFPSESERCRDCLNQCHRHPGSNCCLVLTALLKGRLADFSHLAGSGIQTSNLSVTGPKLLTAILPAIPTITCYIILPWTDCQRFMFSQASSEPAIS